MKALRVALIFLAISKPISAWAVDLQPNDIVAPPPGLNILTLSYFSTENTTFYRNGVANAKPIGASPVIDTQYAILRGSTTYLLGELPGVSYIQLPYGTVSPAGSLANNPNSTGIGDLTVATAFWPYANKNTRTYLAIAAYLTSPTGTYSPQQVFNVSENRFRTDLQMGFQTPITKSLDGMIAVDTRWYGGNSECAAACGLATNGSLTQKPLTTTQLGPIYKINSTFTVGASYFYVAGGATSVNNNYLNNVVNTQRFLLSGQAHTPIGRISLQYGRDMEIKNGFMQTRVLALRLQKSF